MRQLIVLIVTALLLAACSDPAVELYETAQFEEKQFNREHALQLYRQILREHPNSSKAAEAKARLAALEEKTSP